ncbi:NAD-binding protein, partial [Candidatus Bipolaricaulota bacterium]|nr:NAD-binding protein [Candidatus Bipolaricaulota bacterium]
EKCEDLSREYDALVLQGDGTEPELLESGGAREADALIATTGSDSLNMVISTLGKKFAIPNVVAKLNKTGLRTTALELGVDHVISPKLSAATEVSTLLQGYNVLDFSLLVQGGAKMIEISPGPLTGNTLKEIDLPKGTLITAILREGKAIIPQGETKLKAADILILLAENEKKKNQVKNLFGELKIGLRPRAVKEN